MLLEEEFQHTVRANAGGGESEREGELGHTVDVKRKGLILPT